MFSVLYDPSVFRFSKNKKQFPVSVLMANLVKLVNATSDPELEPTTIPPEYENDQFAQNPELIVGKTIYHTFVVDEETKEQETFKGKVISQVRVGRNKSHFNVTYDDFSDKYWTYQILHDYFEGDLRFE